MEVMRIILLILLSNLAAQSEQPYTLRLVTSGWDIRGNGRTVMRSQSTHDVARRSDGAIWSRTEATETRFLSKGQTTVDEQISFPPSTLVTVDRLRKTFAIFSPAQLPSNRVRFPQDQHISRCAAQRSPEYENYRFQGTVQLFGLIVEKWVMRGQWPEVIYHDEVFVAPALDCIPIKFTRSRTTVWRIGNYDVFQFPASQSTTEPTQLTLGEPAGHLFNLPSGFHQVEGSGIMLGPGR